MSREYSDLVGDGGPQYNDQIQDEISIFDPLSETSNESSNDNDNIPLSMDVVTPSSGSDLKAAFFNMTNSIVGAGIVGIPMHGFSEFRIIFRCVVNDRFDNSK